MGLPSASVPRFNIRYYIPWLDPNSQQARDIKRLRRFSDGFVAREPFPDSASISLGAAC